ncbi:hypothetical protein ACO2Q1_03800 [Brevundimonas sp. VNH65]|uniref:hypothetical protein n=1 Tax=Brevundimonas sp. VNH65 TaxID=3400917 RepID=UPI003C0F85FB
MLASGVLASACSTPPAAVAARAATEPAPTAVRVAELTQPVGTRMPPPAMTDMCKAEGLQWLVGRPRTEIPIAADIVNRRVVCTTCPVTEDYSPYRLNIFFNAETDKVELVRCG